MEAENLNEPKSPALQQGAVGGSGNYISLTLKGIILMERTLGLR